MHIVDLTAPRVDETAVLLYQAFKDRTATWPDVPSARSTVLESMDAGKISRIALGDSEKVIGWIGAIPIYDGHVWEIHPIVVATEHRRSGVGRALIRDLENLARDKGALTLWAGSDDENHETSLSSIDLYVDLSAAIREIKNLKRHPYEFFLKAGFRIVGVMPDANGPGKPDIFLAKRVER
jgi:aminoglycoside 6'-N-acetyltransferase I